MCLCVAVSRSFDSSFSEVLIPVLRPRSLVRVLCKEGNKKRDQIGFWDVRINKSRTACCLLFSLRERIR